MSHYINHSLFLLPFLNSDACKALEALRKLDIAIETYSSKLSLLISSKKRSSNQKAQISRLHSKIEMLFDLKHQIVVKLYDEVDLAVDVVDRELEILESESKNKNGDKLPQRARGVKRKLPSVDMAIDPNEPRYCICNQHAFGQMISCDNEACNIEWFHYPCVKLTRCPKAKWYCPICAPQFALSSN